ncbi:MAG: MOSC domain-containing protein [Alteromonadaceae bacterium]|nr:MOSC domain-containing protein [Alteromonadaceae bacterium]MBH85687.1 MOSC domain-containing protein [Alteromonadaceae bacterium]|tara:strand:- start:63144 stop:63959 length:816 start_codon:yes stop_codon:yes gene_type:complete
MALLTVEQLYYYPVKSLRGIAVDSLDLSDFGPLNDRRWMIVDSDGKFVTQREQPRLAQVSAQLTSSGLQLCFPAIPPSLDETIVAVEFGSQSLAVTVWKDTVRAIVAKPASSEALSRFLGLQVQLVYMPQDVVREADTRFTEPGRRVGFADGFPFLVTHQASLDALSRRIGSDIEMRRFRPNIVVSGGEAFAEDRWRTLTREGLTLTLVKPCSRCIMTTVDPWLGVKSDDRQPLRELGSFRRTDAGVIFGMNAVHDGAGPIKVGDQFEISE